MRSTHVQSSCGDCSSIGMLEHHLHDVFAAVRVPGEDFVYAANAEHFNLLEDYCDFDNVMDDPTALLIMGEPGGGKSALLSNWLLRRSKSLSRARGKYQRYCSYCTVALICYANSVD